MQPFPELHRLISAAVVTQLTRGHCPPTAISPHLFLTTVVLSRVTLKQKIAVCFSGLCVLDHVVIFRRGLILAAASTSISLFGYIS